MEDDKREFDVEKPTKKREKEKLFNDNRTEVNVGETSYLLPSDWVFVWKLAKESDKIEPVQTTDKYWLRFSYSVTSYLWNLIFKWYLCFF